jgi:hypothetical protein
MSITLIWSSIAPQVEPPRTVESQIELYIDVFDSKINDINIFFNIGSVFLKKISKNLNLLTKCKQKIMSNELDSHIDNDSNNFISWFCN